MTDRKLLLLNGPNLNLLGIREPEVYGTATLDDAVDLSITAASARGFSLDHLQSNHEGVLIDAIHDARLTADGIVINPGGLTHTSVALRDALSGVSLPFAEIHVSDPLTRESFRHHSYLTDIAAVHVVGEGVPGYATAINRLIDVISTR